MPKSKLLKATDLLKDEKERYRFREKNYKIQFEKCLHAVQIVNEHCHKTFTFYNVPYSLPGDPNFEINECTHYVRDKLLEHDFYTKLMKPGNVIYISWSEADIAKAHDKLKKKRDKEKRGKVHTKPLQTEHIIEVDTSTPLGRLHLASSLMKSNPEYSKYVKKKRKN